MSNPPGPPHSLDGPTPYGDPFDEQQRHGHATQDSTTQISLMPLGNPGYAASDVTLDAKLYEQDATQEPHDAFDESRPLTGSGQSLYPPSSTTFVSFPSYSLNRRADFHPFILFIASTPPRMENHTREVQAINQAIRLGRAGRPFDVERLKGSS
jgi:hypothetical protein